MALRPAEGVEPVTGYRLVQRLGTGGYGEVWKATAPGGLTKAIKIIYGHLRDARAEQELRAMSRIKEVRHPFLLSLERVEIIDDQVFIITELADGSLMDRYEARRKDGHAGISRDELLAYFRDAADALDYMNDHYGLQHLDIKPQNLLIVGGRIKIADFGLVKDLQGTSATATGGVTPIYASPEAFDGKVSRFSDQYSLAIVYQELLTGYRPFPGKSALQLAAQHMNSPPLLDPLPLADRPVIARALAKIADQRFPSCRDLVEALQRAQLDSAVSGAISSRAMGRGPVLGKSGDSIRSAPPQLPQQSTESAEEDLLSQQTLANFALHQKAGITPPLKNGDQDRLTTTSNPLARPRVHLRPTLFVGLGGLAGLTLRSLRRKLIRHFGSLGKAPIFKFLQLDTDRAGLRLWQQGGDEVAFDPEESLLLPLHRPEHYRPESKELLRWLDRRWLYGIPRSLLTEGMRPLGRLAFVTNSLEVRGKMREALCAITSPEAKAAAQATGMRLRSDAPRIFVVSGITGGTGGGMLVDIGQCARELLSELQLSPEGLCAMMLYASGDKPGDIDLARVNAYATLSELNHFSRDDSGFSDRAQIEMPCKPQEAPFEDCYLIQLGQQLPQSEVNAATDSLAEYLYLDAAVGAGDFLDQYRHATRKTGPGTPADIQLRTCGVSKLTFPRHAIADLTAPTLCRQLLRRWLEPSNPAEQESFKAEALSQAAAVGLEAQSLVDHLHAKTREVWDEDPDKYFQRNLTDWLHDLSPLLKDKSPDHLVSQLLARIDSVLGPDGKANSAAGQEAKPIELTVRNETLEIEARLSQAVVLWLKSQVDGRRGRLQAVDHAAHCLLQQLAFLNESAGYLLEEGKKNRKLLKQQLAEADFSGGNNPSRWLGLSRRPPAKGDPLPRLLEICRLRLKEMVLENVTGIFRAVSDKILRFKQELALVRAKLDHLADKFGDHEAARRASADKDVNTAKLTQLLPKRADSLPAAAQVLYRQVEAELVPSFEERLRAEILEPQGGFWTMLNREADGLDDMRLQMESRARQAMLNALRQIDAAGLYMESSLENEANQQALAAHIQAASPPLLTPDSWHHLLVALPPGSASAQLKAKIADACPDLQTTTIDSEGDVVFCFEATHLNLSLITRSLASGESEFFSVARQAMTRTDVSWSAPALEGEYATTLR